MDGFASRKIFWIISPPHLATLLPIGIIEACQRGVGDGRPDASGTAAAAAAGEDR